MREIYKKNERITDICFCKERKSEIIFKIILRVNISIKYKILNKSKKKNSLAMN